MSQVQLNKSAIVLVALMEKPSLPITLLMEKDGEANRSRFRNNILNPLIEAQLVEPTQKDTPQSPKQEYALTAKCKGLLNDCIENKLIHTVKQMFRTNGILFCWKTQRKSVNLQAKKEWATRC